MFSVIRGLLRLHQLVDMQGLVQKDCANFGCEKVSQTALDSIRIEVFHYQIYRLRHRLETGLCMFSLANP